MTSQNEKLAEYMSARPWQWLPMVELGGLVGAWAVHSRIADLRRDYGMNVVNRKWKRGDVVISEYQYQPEARQQAFNL